MLLNLHLKDNGVSIMSKKKMLGTKKELEQMYYNKKMTMPQIAKKFDCTKATVWKYFKKYGLKARKMVGSNHGSWKGGRVIKMGYIAIWNPSHPRTNNVGYVKEHILVMEKKLKRQIEKEEHIHHIDFDRMNNNPKNLWLCDINKHRKAELSLYNLVKDLIEKKIIKFNKNKGKYQIC